MFEKQTKTLLHRRVIILVLLVGSAIAQNCVLPFASGGFRVWFLLPLVVIAAMFEKETAGAFFGLLGGCLWDNCAATTDGVKALFFAVAGAVCGLLIRYVMRNNLLSALVLCAAVTFIFMLSHWFVNVVLLSTAGSVSALFRFYLPQALLTVLSVPLFYFLLRAIEKRLRPPGEAR